MVDMRREERVLLVAAAATVFLRGRTISEDSLFTLVAEPLVFFAGAAALDEPAALEGGFRDLVLGGSSTSSPEPSVSMDGRDFFVGGGLGSPSSSSCTSSKDFLERAETRLGCG